MDEVRAKPNSLWLALESIESPGNLGTIIRTAEAAGATGIFIVNRDCDPYDPATVRATMGSLFSQKLTRCSPHEFTNWAKANGVAVVASSPAGLMDYKALSYRFPAALIIGSEKRGLSMQVLEICGLRSSYSHARRLRFDQCGGRSGRAPVRAFEPEEKAINSTSNLWDTIMSAYDRYTSRLISDKPCQGERFGHDGFPRSCGDTPVWELVHSSGPCLHICGYHIEFYWNAWLPFRSVVRDTWPVNQGASHGDSDASA